MSTLRSRWMIAVLFVTAGAVAGLRLAGSHKLPSEVSTASLPPQATSPAIIPNPHFKLQKQQSKKTNDGGLALGDLKRASQAFALVAEKVIPAVVSIATQKVFPAAEWDRSEQRMGRGNFFDDRGLRFYQPRANRQQGSGSGIILTPDGYILTNVHVIDFAKKITVTLHDNRAFSGKIVGLDPLTEVAVVKIEAHDLTVAILGNSDGLIIGQWVLAVGNPLNLRSTVTAGIISAEGRDLNVIQGDYGIENFIQTDAAINPGNSGGALVNLAGQVIGINTAIATETGYAMGLGFAIPINLARKIAVDLIRYGKVTRGYLGIALQEITEVHARALRLGVPAGVLVDEVYDGSPAQRHGLLPLDVILSVDGKSVQRINQLQAMIAGKTPGAVINLHLIRDGKEIDKKLTLGELPPEQSAANIKNQTGRSRFRNLGISVESISEADAVVLGYTQETGVLVARVEKFSPAEESGLRADDIIVAMDRKTLRSKEDFFASLPELKSGEVAIFTVFRRGGNYHFFVDVP